MINAVKRFWLVLLITCNCTYSVPAYAGWQKQSHGLNGGTIQSIVVSPTNSQTIYAGGDNGIFISINGGVNWTLINKSPTYVYSLAIDPNNSQVIYAGTMSYGLYKSDNGGWSWNAINSGLSADSIVIDPSNSQKVYIGASGGVYMSSNGGKSWIAVYNGQTTYANSLVIDRNNTQTIYAGIQNRDFDGSVGSVVKSIDGGVTWTAINNGMNVSNVETLAIDPTNGQTIYAGTSYNGIFKSNNGGASWSPINNGLTGTASYNPVHSLAIDPTNSQTIYAGTYNSGIFKSSNGGESWSSVSSGLSLARVYSLAIDQTNSQIVYAGVEDGGAVFKSSNGGQSWSIKNSGITTTHQIQGITSLAIDPNNSQNIYASSSNSSNILKSSNGGTDWSATLYIETNVRVLSLAIDKSNSQIIYAGSSGGAHFYKSGNGGRSWSAPSIDLKNQINVSSLVIDPINSQTIYAGGNGGIFKSINGGGNWGAKNTGLTSTYVTSIVIDPINNQTIYAGTTNGGVPQNGGVFKSTNGGNSWSAINSGLSTTNVYSLVIDPTNSQTIYAGTNGEGIFKSSNGGANWTAINSGLTYKSVNTLAIDPVNGQIIYAAVSSGGIFKSSDGGTSWSAINSGLPNYDTIQTIAIDPLNTLTVYAGTSGGSVLKTTDGGTAPNTYSVAPAMIVNGTISPNNPQTVLTGSTAKFTIIPATGYQIDRLMAGSCPQGWLSGTSYTTGTIDADCIIVPMFSPVLVNGVCGSAKGTSLPIAPTNNLCSAGISSNVSGNGPWEWSCTGLNGGVTAICSANLLKITGDCDNSDTVTIAEVQSAINMFLGLKAVASCVDIDINSSVSIAEVQKTINAFLGLSGSNAAPLANAGIAQNVVINSVVILDATASSDTNGDPLTYNWTLTAKPEGSIAALSNSTAIKPTISPDLAGIYTFSLIVNDGKVNSSVATVTITAVISTQNSSPWIGKWTQINFLSTDDNGVWSSDILTGVGYVAEITASQWNETDEYGNGCTDTYSYSLNKNLVHKIGTATSCTSPPNRLELLALGTSGRLEFQDNNDIMIEHYDPSPGDTIVAFKWRRR